MAIKLAIPQGDIAGHMRKWEQTYFGPYVKNSTLDNFENWAELEFSPAKKINKAKPLHLGKNIDIRA